MLLHRIFIEKGLPEELQFISFDSETNLCPAIYVSSCFSLPLRMTIQLFTFSFSVVCYDPNALVIIATVRHSRTLDECPVTANNDIHREIDMREKDLPTMTYTERYEGERPANNDIHREI